MVTRENILNNIYISKTYLYIYVSCLPLNTFNKKKNLRYFHDLALNFTYSKNQPTDPRLNQISALFPQMEAWINRYEDREILTSREHTSL